MRRSLPALFLLLAGAAAPGLAGVDDAKRAMRQLEPAQCEVLTMRFEAETIPAGAGREAFMERLYRHSEQVEQRLANETREYERAIGQLSTAEREEVMALAAALLRECTKRASERHGVKLVVPVGQPADRPKVLPHAAADPKGSQGAAATPLEAQSPQPR